MAYKFTTKRSSKQQETAYILYMIISSYFHKCICRTRGIEKNLLLYYKDMPFSKQESREAEIITICDKKFSNILPDIARMNAVAVIRKKAAGYELLFSTGFEAIHASVDAKGNYQIAVLESL